DTSTLSWIVANPRERRLTVAIADELAPSLGAGARRVRLRLAPGAAQQASTTICPSRRGRYRISELVVRVDGPLGLASRQGRRAMPVELRVYPAFGSRGDAELRIARSRVLDIGLRSAVERGQGTDFDQLREYGVDDDARRIDWAATARAAKPIVRTYRAERNQTVAVLLDNGRTMAGTIGGVPRVEHAMDAVLMLASVVGRLGDRVGLVAFDRQVRAVVPPASGAHQVLRVSEALYRLEPELAESDYQGAFVATLARFPRRALLCILTELTDESLVETLLPALPLILRTHLVVIGAVRDPEIGAWAADEASTPVEVYRQVAALQSRAQRRLMAGRLRGLGAVVVDAEPGALAPALADAYLRVKATGRL
ncbi:MAG: DUF58 domain-containing protein, partial [Actinomycetota bacterium]|nr:DUF58 domain-containing protein [Actinomycetota bacterium]